MGGPMGGWLGSWRAGARCTACAEAFYAREPSDYPQRKLAAEAAAYGTSGAGERVSQCGQRRCMGGSVGWGWVAIRCERRRAIAVAIGASRDRRR